MLAPARHFLLRRWRLERPSLESRKLEEQLPTGANLVLLRAHPGDMT
jgi:hypothetical protein